jgi:hypothetical protein
MVDPSLPNHLSQNTGSKSAIEFLARKYRECNDKHDVCKLQQTAETFYSSRVIDVGTSDSSSICLRDTKGFRDEGQYACLSHCWGQAKPFVLSKHTESKLKKGLPISALPKTFQDAIFVTRQLRIRFLWTDSL